MALADKLAAHPGEGRSKATPVQPADLEALTRSFVHVADVYARPDNVKDYSQDLSRVIALMPNVFSHLVRGKGEKIVYRGQFAYGEAEGEGVRFRIYIPHGGITRRFPSDRLKSNIANLMYNLVEQGYVVTGMQYLEVRKFD